MDYALCSFQGPSQHTCVTCKEAGLSVCMADEYLFSTKRYYEGSTWISVRRFSWLPAASKVELQIRSLLFPFLLTKIFYELWKKRSSGGLFLVKEAALFHLWHQYI